MVRAAEWRHTWPETLELPVDGQTVILSWWAAGKTTRGNPRIEHAIYTLGSRAFLIRRTEHETPGWDWPERKWRYEVRT